MLAKEYLLYRFAVLIKQVVQISSFLELFIPEELSEEQRGELFKDFHRIVIEKDEIDKEITAHGLEYDPDITQQRNDYYRNFSILSAQMLFILPDIPGT